MKYSNYVKYGLVAVALLAGTAFGVKYAFDKGFDEGRQFGEFAVWAYCFSTGGILTNPEIPGAAIGCMAIEPTVAPEQRKYGDPGESS